MMRITLLIIAVWGLGAIPVLCETGVWTMCCGQSSSECPDTGCDEKGCQDEHDSDCDCPGCVALCNAHVMKPTVGTDLPVVSAVNPLLVLPVSSDGESSGEYRVLLAQSGRLPHLANVPYAPSDRPLLL